MQSKIIESPALSWVFFANGAVTDAFAYSVINGIPSALGNKHDPSAKGGSSDNKTSNQSQMSGAMKVLCVIGDVAGKIWAFPMTLMGTFVGGIGHIVGEIGYAMGWYGVNPSIKFGNNAIQFINNPRPPSTF